MGTPEFAVKELENIAREHEVVAAVTQPDRARDRGKAVKSCPVKECAERLGIQVLQYEKISRDGVDELKALAPDIMVTAAYGQILSNEILGIAKFGVVNIHASLLPKYRGSAPIQWAIMSGETETGITIMQTSQGVDCGDIIYQESTPIGADETSEELFKRLSETGASAIIKALKLIESGKAQFTKQNESKATRCRMLTKADGKLDFCLTAKQLHDRARAIPCYFSIDGKTYKAFDLKAADGKGTCGEIIKADKELVIACKDGAVKVGTIQAEGGKRMATDEYLKGHSFIIGTRVDS